MKNSLFLVFIFIISGFFIACSSPSLDDYRGQEPAVDLMQLFDGELMAYGIVRNRSGKVIRYFTAQLTGSWDQGVGTLDEVFWFDDGERQTRIWTMTPDGQGNYIGTAADVEGTALIQTRGNAVRLAYRLQVPYKDDTITLTMDVSGGAWSDH